MFPRTFLNFLKSSRKIVRVPRRFSSCQTDTNTHSKLFKEIETKIDDVIADKVSIVGVGRVGIACASSLLSKNITNNIVLVDCDQNKINGEALDLQHGSLFWRSSKITTSSSYKSTANSKICIIAAGSSQPSTEESQIKDLGECNAKIFKEIIPKIVECSPNAILIIATEPVDAMSHTAWKLSCFPRNRVIGTGTSLNIMKFRERMADKLAVPSKDCHIFIIGDHCDDQITLWSTMNVAGVRLREINPDIATSNDKEDWCCLKEMVNRSSNDILALKRSSENWAIGLCICHLVDAILNNRNAVVAVSTNVNGLYGVDFDTFLSLPCVLNTNGVCKIVKPILDDEEKTRFKNSACKHKEFIESLKL